MAWWNIVALATGVLCMAGGIVAFTVPATGLAIGLLVSGFILLLLAGTWSYVADLVLALV